MNPLGEEVYDSVIKRPGRTEYINYVIKSEFTGLPVEVVCLFFSSRGGGFIRVRGNASVVGISIHPSSRNSRTSEQPLERERFTGKASPGIAGDINT